MSADDCHPIETLVDRETTAWNERDVEALLDLFHPDMVWAWPPTADDHDPVHWVMPLGRFDRARWGQQWADLFATHDLPRLLVDDARLGTQRERSARDTQQCRSSCLNGVRQCFYFPFRNGNFP